MPLSAVEAIPWARECGFELLPPDLPHRLTLKQRPLHQRDPFSRRLVAHSISESLQPQWPYGSGSLCRPANRSKSRSKLTRRQPLAIARAARWASVQSRAGIFPPRSSW
jgi:hypothetical protein